MDTLDESWVEKKLMAATNTQESVQSLSMWALHHKTQHEKIVSIWFRVLKMGMQYAWFLDNSEINTTHITEVLRSTVLFSVRMYCN